MYNWIDGRNFQGSKNLQALNLISKTLNPLVRNRFDVNSFKRLPVIKEEEGNANDDELEAQQNLLRNVLRSRYRNKRGMYMRNSNNEIKNYERIIESKSLTRLPPLVSINCLIEDNIAEAQRFWEAKYGKYLINRRFSAESLNSSDHKFQLNSTKQTGEKSGDYQSSRFLLRKKSLQEQNIKDAVGGKRQFSQARCHKGKKTTVKEPDVKKKPSLERAYARKIPEESFNVSPFHKSQQFLKENIQNSIKGHSREIDYKNSNESFSIVEDLCKQRKHDTDKETCILCEKVFSSPQKFIHHLLTHEAVDKLSCKKCKIHFFSLRKYKQHCKDFHFTSSDANKSQNFEFVKTWLPLFECKRCKVSFDSEQNYESHKRIHIKREMGDDLNSKNA